MLWVLLLVFAFLLFSIAVLRLHPFPALILAAILTGVFNGLPIAKIIAGINSGMGSTLGPVAAVIGLGVMLGALLTESGAASAISNRLLQQWGIQHLQAAVVITSFLCGIALFYNAGFVVLLPLVLSLAHRAQIPSPFLALSMAAALSVTHGYLPPHPGPTAIAQLLDANMGKTLMYGLVAAVPAIIVGGWWFPKTIKQLQPQTPAGVPPSVAEQRTNISFSASMLLALLPVLLMATGIALQQISTPDSFMQTTGFSLADPLFALLLSFLCALITFSRLKKLRGAHLSEKSATALQSVAGIIFIIAGGGALKQMLVDTGLAAAVSQLFMQWQLHPLLSAWLVAGAVRIAIGSATVAGITAAGVVQPLIGTTGVSSELMVLAIGAGSLMCSHINDSGFWMFKEYLGLSVADTFRSWTVMETLVGITGLLMVLLMNQFI